MHCVQCTQSATDAARNERLFGSYSKPSYGRYDAYSGRQTNDYHSPNGSGRSLHGQPSHDYRQSDSNGWLPHGQLPSWHGSSHSRGQYGRVQYDYV